MKLSEIVEFIVNEISVQKASEKSEIDKNRNWYDLGMDSVEIFGLACSIEDNLNIEVDEDVMIDHSTVSDLATYIHKTIAG